MMGLAAKASRVAEAAKEITGHSEDCEALTYPLEHPWRNKEDICTCGYKKLMRTIKDFESLSAKISQGIWEGEEVKEVELETKVGS